MDPWFENLLIEYGATIGLERFQANEKKVAGLEFTGGERLLFELLEEDGLLVSYLKQVAATELRKTLEQALTRAHFENSMQFPLQPALHGDDYLVYSIYLPREHARVDQLDSAVLQLREAMAATFSC